LTALEAMPMRKSLNAEIAIGFLVASVFWIGVVAWQSSYSPNENEKHQCEESARKSGQKSEECKTIWERTTTDPVAFFTFWLVISTVGLWVATGVGIFFQIKDTRVLQRAYISVKPRGVKVFVTGDAYSCDVSFDNVGNLPARKVEWFIDRVFSRDRFLADLPIPQDRYEGNVVIAPGASMKKGGKHIDKESFKAAINGPRPSWLYVWGAVRYDDGFGTSRFTNFCHRYNIAATASSGGIAEEDGRYHVHGNDAD
jgi:hypothetical protein